MIKLYNVSKQLDGHAVLNDLSFTIEEGKIYGLIGPNGTGKSTLLRLISGILELDQGSLQINDKPLQEDHRLKKDIIYVSDDPYFFGMSTLKELRQFYRIFYTTFNESIYYRLLNHFQVNEHTRLSSFSKGMKRQVSLILGLSLEPKVLLLDEAFDGLDPVMRSNLVHYLKNQVLEKKLAVVIASHNIHDLEDICNHIFLLFDGALIDMGNKLQPKTKLYAYQLQFNKPINLREIELLDSLVHYEIKENELQLIVNEPMEELTTKFSLISYQENTLNLEEIFIYTLKERGYGKLI